MDSITQIVLGAAVGEVLMGKKMGNKAQLIGAIAGTVPDLDVLTSLWIHDEVTKLHIHRGYSHAVFTHVFLAIPMAYITALFFKKKYSFKDLYWVWFWALFTHALLDCCTTYGTQLFLPFSNYLVGFNNVSIIDPLYTLPFMGFLIACLFYRKDDPRRIQLAWLAVWISTAYMLLTCMFKYDAHRHFEMALQEQHLSHEELSTSPTIFNSFLWAGIAADDSLIHVSEYSIFQGDKPIEFATYPRNLSLEKGWESEALRTAKWFSQHKYFIKSESSDTLNFFNIKWGRGDFTKQDPKEAFMFYTQLTKVCDEVKFRTIEPTFKDGQISEALGKLWERTFSANK